MKLLTFSKTGAVLYLAWVSIFFIAAPPAGHTTEKKQTAIFQHSQSQSDISHEISILTDIQKRIVEKLDILHTQGDQIQTAVLKQKKRTFRLQGLLISLFVLVGLLLGFIIYCTLNNTPLDIKSKIKRDVAKLRSIRATDFIHFLLKSSKKFSLSILILAISLGMAEVFLTAFSIMPDNTSFWGMNVRNFNGNHDGGTSFNVMVKTNSQGLREIHEIKSKKPGVYRIALVGDSMTFGWGIENNETMSRQLTKHLTETMGLQNVEVINFGIPGTGPYQYYRVINKYVREVEADLVITNVLMANDTHMRVPISYMDDNETKDILKKMITDGNKEDEDPEHEWRNSFIWKFSVFRFAIRVINKLNGIDINYHGVMWAGPDSSTRGTSKSTSQENSQKEKRQAESKKKTSCELYLITSRLCLQTFRSELKSDRSRGYFDWMLQNDYIEKACNCFGEDPANIEAKIKYVDIIQDLMVPDGKRSEEIYSHYRAVLMQLEHIQKTVLSFGAKSLVVFLPQGWVVDKRSMARDTKENIFVQEMLENTVESDFLIQESQKMGIMTESALDEVRKHALDEKSLFLPGDYHPSAQGNMVYVKWLSEKIGPFLLDMKAQPAVN